MVVEIYCEWDKAYVVTVSPVVKFCDFYLTSIAQLSRETALQGGLVLAKSGRLELGDILPTLYVYLQAL